MLLWTCDVFSRPTFRNLTDSFESWAYRNGLLRQLQRLEKKQWIERKPVKSDDRLYRITPVGRLHALNGCDPPQRWNRHWDGRWRMVVYDVPEKQKTSRNKLRLALRNRGFGYLQNSVWITPDPIQENTLFSCCGSVDAGSLILFEARPSGGESDTEIVAAAWDFAETDRLYALHQGVLLRRPRQHINTPAAATALHRWIRAERKAWQAALMKDPLLPKALLPPGYSGCAAWKKRMDVMREAARQMRMFRVQGK